VARDKCLFAAEILGQSTQRYFSALPAYSAPLRLIFLVRNSQHLKSALSQERSRADACPSGHEFLLQTPPGTAARPHPTHEQAASSLSVTPVNTACKTLTSNFLASG